MAASFISGKQARAEFRQGMNDINNKLQNTIDDVSNGFYPYGKKFKCTAALTGPPSVTSTSPNGQGENQGCVFLGKVIQFGVPSTDGVGYNVYTVTGRQYANGSSDNSLSSSFADAQPVAVDNSDVNLTEYNSLQWGLSLTKMYSNNAPVGAIGFFGSFDSAGASDAGSQSTNLAALSTTSLGESESNLLAAIKQYTQYSVVSQPNIVLCFSGGSGQVGSITIGGNGQRLATDMELGNKVAGTCKS